MGMHSFFRIWKEKSKEILMAIPKLYSEDWIVWYLNQTRELLLADVCPLPVPADELPSKAQEVLKSKLQMGEHMAERQQVYADSSSSNDDEESPKPQTSQSRRIFKASNMAFIEMVETVDIFKRVDYDGKHGPYPNPNVRRAKIMPKVVKSLQKNFGVRRSKDQLRKRWSDLKLREQDQYRRIKRVLQKREKRLGTSEVTRDPQHPKEGEVTTPQPQDVEEGEVYEVGQIVTGLLTDKCIKFLFGRSILNYIKAALEVFQNSKANKETLFRILEDLTRILTNASQETIRY
ncbi:hypothetical protein AB205_0183600 [Aquarana catesbeiana]|uniref:Uncharacterized protein n=1 Tax=Aquarana catesbeiana TaxID=8400 RepID=A0A2G9P414_AQUCT|nr:hypothetical protein AB205_0183600 [Aquarana catesbeiana]